MSIRPIVTEEDYQATLSRIRSLWDAKPGSAQRHELDVLAMLAHNYERALEPLPDLTPAEA